MKMSRPTLLAIAIPFVSLLALLTGVGENGCPQPLCSSADWQGHTYVFCYAPGLETDWAAAREACANLNPPMDLVAVNSADEQYFLDQEWQRYGAEAVPIQNHVGNPEYVAYIGFNDIAVEGQWTWSNGDSPAFANWCPGEPNNAGDEDCAVMGWSANYDNGIGCPDLAWNDIPCEAVVAYICESLE